MADIAINVLAELDGSGTLTDISERVRAVRVRYGRQRGQYHYATGTATVSLHSADNFLLPGGGSSQDAVAVQGGVLAVQAKVGKNTPITIWRGWIDDVLWRGSAQTASVVLVGVDGLARLAEADITADLPAERTGARIERLLDLAGYPAGNARNIDGGSVMCPATSVSGTALDLLRRCEITEGGRLHIAHTQGTDGGVLKFASRQAQAVVAATVTDAPTALTHILPDGEPLTEQDPDLLATAVEFALPNDAGTISRQSDEAIARYGLHTFSADVFSGADDTDDLAQYWLDRYAQSYYRVRRLDIAPHFESLRAAQVALSATIGDTVLLSYTPAGGTQPVPSNSEIDSVQISANALAPAVGAAAIQITWQLFPRATAAYWIMADFNAGVLGRTTRLAPPEGSADFELARNVPGGRVRFADGRTVTAAAYTAGITSQVASHYTSPAARSAAEVAPHIGQAAAVALDNSGSRLPRIDLAVWTGRRWTPQLGSLAPAAVRPPATPTLAASNTGGTGSVLTFSWQYADPAGSPQEAIQLRRETQRVWATGSSHADDIDADAPLTLVTAVRYLTRNGWRPDPTAFLERTTHAQTLPSGWGVPDQEAPHIYRLRVRNELGLWSEWSEPVSVELLPPLPAPTVTLRAPARASNSRSLTLSWDYTQADRAPQFAYWLWYVNNSGVLVGWTGSQFLANYGGGVGGAASSVRLPSGWGAGVSERHWYLRVAANGPPGTAFSRTAAATTSVAGSIPLGA